MLNMINFLKSLFTEKYFTGVLPDTRSSEEIKKDWLYEETASAEDLNINYVTKGEADFQKKYVVYNQLSTSGCLAHATALELSIAFKNKLQQVFKGLAFFIYRLRSNFKGEGMIPQNSNDLPVKCGIPHYELQGGLITDEKQANAFVITDLMYEDALKQRPIGYFKFKNIFWEAIASEVSKGRPVKICIDATYREWAKEWVSVMDKPVHGYAPISHAIVCLPNTVFKQGNEEYVLIQDSAWFGGLFYRYIPKSFFDAGRCYYASYFTDIKYGSDIKPHFSYSTPMQYGMKGWNVIALQNCLIYEGLLPSDCNTGWFGGATMKAVKLFQEKYRQDILAPLSLTQPTGIAGIYTLRKLKQLYP